MGDDGFRLCRDGLLTATENSTSLTYTYDALERVARFTGQAGRASTYNYDLAGNRLSSAYPGGVTVKGVYDSSGRFWKPEDGSSNVLGTRSYDVGGRATGLSLANGTSITPSFDLVSRLTSVTKALTSGDRNYSYVYDSANRTRYYNPTLGRFISRDPLSGAEFSQGTNLYAYCRNNFLNATDPTGMCLLDGKLTAGGYYGPDELTKDLTAGLNDNSSSSLESIEGTWHGTGGADWILGLPVAAAEGLIDLAAPGVESLFASSAADTSMTTVTHFTNAAGAAGIGDGGTLGAGQFVTTSNLSGFNGPLTSDGAYQFQLINPAQVSTFTPTP
jgi:RHS repeat-associated protein